MKSSPLSGGLAGSPLASAKIAGHSFAGGSPDSRPAASLAGGGAGEGARRGAKKKRSLLRRLVRWTFIFLVVGTLAAAGYVYHLQNAYHDGALIDAVPDGAQVVVLLDHAAAAGRRETYGRFLDEVLGSENLKVALGSPTVRAVSAGKKPDDVTDQDAADLPDRFTRQVRDLRHTLDALPVDVVGEVLGGEVVYAMRQTPVTDPRGNPILDGDGLPAVRTARLVAARMAGWKSRAAAGLAREWGVALASAGPEGVSLDQPEPGHLVVKQPGEPPLYLRIDGDAVLAADDEAFFKEADALLLRADPKKKGLTASARFKEALARVRKTAPEAAAFLWADVAWLRRRAPEIDAKFTVSAEAIRENAMYKTLADLQRITLPPQIITGLGAAFTPAFVPGRRQPAAVTIDACLTLDPSLLPEMRYTEAVAADPARGLPERRVEKVVSNAEFVHYLKQVHGMARQPLLLHEAAPADAIGMATVEVRPKMLREYLQAVAGGDLVFENVFDTLGSHASTNIGVSIAPARYEPTPGSVIFPKRAIYFLTANAPPPPPDLPSQMANTIIARLGGEKVQEGMKNNDIQVQDLPGYPGAVRVSIPPKYQETIAGLGPVDPACGLVPIRVRDTEREIVYRYLGFAFERDYFTRVLDAAGPATASPPADAARARPAPEENARFSLAASSRWEELFRPLLGREREGWANVFFYADVPRLVAYDGDNVEYRKARWDDPDKALPESVKKKIADDLAAAGVAPTSPTFNAEWDARARPLCEQEKARVERSLADRAQANAMLDALAGLIRFDPDARHLEARVVVTLRTR
ncbi:MAG: hypothetical protein HY719_03710 [Planctomycetes bacterium]|nr:hypothetical protein [Planctomycetota bacterium]